MIAHGRVLILERDPERASQVAQLLTFLGYEPWPSPTDAGTSPNTTAAEIEPPAIVWTAVVLGETNAADEARLAAITADAPELPVLDAQDFAATTPRVPARRARRTRPSLAPTGASRAAQQLAQLVTQVAPSNATVLILGESGTGKE
ncbi:MAG: sigma 54-interacting transcriptional regulator, partial [Pseudomonadota bacterium]